MFVELHIIQNFPPSNLNRDDIGQPKTTDFGGVRRARISSQCQKRAIRLHPEFKKATLVEPSKRTQLMVKGLTDRLVAPDIVEEPPSEVRAVSVCVAEAYAKKKTDANKKTGAIQTPTLIFLSKAELDWLSDHVRQAWADAMQASVAIADAEQAIKKASAENDKKAEDAAKKALKSATEFFDKIVEELVKRTKERTSAPDIALFGRMLADRPETNIDAACQVAHAISTHGIGKLEMDYYTAMDDIKQEMKDPGAGFLDVAYFTSACFYRYMRIDCGQLEKTLGDADLVRNTVKGFMRAAEAAIPTGKINSHAQLMRPSFMLAVVRKDESDGWNLANAFEKPVTARPDQGIIEQSVKRLEARFDHLRRFYGDDSVVIASVALPDGSVTESDLGEYLCDKVHDMKVWVETVRGALAHTQEG